MLAPIRRDIGWAQKQPFRPPGRHGSCSFRAHADEPAPLHIGLVQGKDIAVDTSEMRELLQGYLSELNWAGGVTKDDIVECLVERDDALLTMVNEYIAEGTYQHLNDVMTLIPAQAWQDAQGDTWRGVESQYVEDVDTNFREGPLGQLERDANRSAGAPASSSGSGPSSGGASDASAGRTPSPSQHGGSTSGSGSSAGLRTTASGMPCPSTARDRFVPCLPRSTGDLPATSPPPRRHRELW